LAALDGEKECPQILYEFEGMALANSLQLPPNGGLPWKRWIAGCHLRLLDANREPPIRGTVGGLGTNKHPSVAGAFIDQNCAKTSATSGIVHGDRKALLLLSACRRR
jgi:hypothetical protein